MKKQPIPFPLLDEFEFQHLPVALQDVSRPFYNLAHAVANAPSGKPHEVAACLRHLLEAKDCAVRAAIPARHPAAEKPQAPDDQAIGQLLEEASTAMASIRERLAAVEQRLHEHPVVRTWPLPGETSPVVAPGVDTSGWWARRAAENQPAPTVEATPPPPPPPAPGDEAENLPDTPDPA